MRRMSLWEVLAAIVGWTAFAITAIVQLIQLKRKKPSLAEQMESLLGVWLLGWRALTDLSPGAYAEGTSHDAKLSEITYRAEHGSHIKVFFPPDEPGKLEDPSASSLWSVCPAAVYQIVLDKTLHPSVAVNFENCVKCETCWRIEPQHVDWSRWGRHRLTYEVYSEADGALRDLIDARTLSTPLAIEPDYWSGLPGDGLAEGSAEASDELAAAVTAARRAFDIAEAKGEELHANVWRGPRVLQPGQVVWSAQAMDYFAHLAEDAAKAALAGPIEDLLVEQGADATHRELIQLKADVDGLAARIREHAAARHFFAAEADARQLRDHHLAGMRSRIDSLARACMLGDGYRDPVAELRSGEVAEPERASARAALREHLAGVFDRGTIRRLEQGGTLEDGEMEVLRAAARAALGTGYHGGGFDAWKPLVREDILAELGYVDPSLGAVVAGHLAAVDALVLSRAPISVMDPMKGVDRFTTVALEAEADDTAYGVWCAKLPFVFTALADSFVAHGNGRIALFDIKGEGIESEATPALGLTGAVISEFTLKDANPEWEGEWTDTNQAKLLGQRARNITAIALGAAELVTHRAVDHVRGRIQFPDMFQDMDGRDGVGKFGAVRAHISHIEAGRLALETLLNDADWLGGGIEAAVAKVAATDIFGPDMPSITYRAGQVIGGSAFSEEDVFSKVYRDSGVFPHYIRENAWLNVGIGRLLASKQESPLYIIAPGVHAALETIAKRPIFDVEVKRMRAAEERLTAAMRGALAKGVGATAAEVIDDICGELATRLYVWARLLIRAHRRIEAGLPAERHVEAARLWADVIEEALVELDAELGQAADRVELGGYAFQLGGYPDEPIASKVVGFNYESDIIEAERGHRSGDYLIKPFEIEGARYVPEMVWVDDTIRSRYEEYIRLFRERFIEPNYDPPFDRYVEQLHHMPRGHIDWTVEQGFFRVVIPKEYGGQDRSKADYYNLCMISKRLADVSHTLMVQANTSIGTSPILLGLDDVNQAEKELQAALDQADAVVAVEAGVQNILAMMEQPDFDELKNAYMAEDKEIRGAIGKSRILKKVVFGKFMSSWQKGGMAGIKGDLDGFKKGLQKAVGALDGWKARIESELGEMPRRRAAHEFYLKLISAKMISAFALTEPSAGSDTARQRTEARLDSRRVHTDDDGVKYFYLDESEEEGRRNICDMRRYEFDYDNSKILYRYSDDAEPAEIHSLEYTYEEGEEKYRYFMIGERRRSTTSSTC